MAAERPFVGYGAPHILLMHECFQALEKKGISHLEEKELKERNKQIQEDNRLELQKVSTPSGSQHLLSWTSSSPNSG